MNFPLPRTGVKLYLEARYYDGLTNNTHTSLVPIKPSTALVVSGPYRLSRNPMYLGLLCVYIGVALWFGVVWALILVPLLGLPALVAIGALLLILL